MSALKRWKSSEGGRDSVRHQSQRTQPSEDFGAVRREFHRLALKTLFIAMSVVFHGRGGAVV